MTWKFTYDAESRGRILEGRRNFCGVTTTERIHFYPNLKMWDETHIEYERWSTHDDNCRGFRSFKRYLRNHPELKGYEVILVSRYENHHIYANWVE